MPRPTFAGRLKTFLDESPEPQAAIARKAGVSPSLLTRWKNGETAPSLERMQKFAAALGKPSGFFTGGYDGVELGSSPVYKLREWADVEELLSRLNDFRALKCISFVIELSDQTPDRGRTTKRLADRIARRLLQMGLRRDFTAVRASANGTPQVHIRHR